MPGTSRMPWDSVMPRQRGNGTWRSQNGEKISGQSLAVILERSEVSSLSALGSQNLSAVLESQGQVSGGTGEAEPNGRYNSEHLASTSQTVIQATESMSIPMKTVNSVEVGSASPSPRVPIHWCPTKPCEAAVVPSAITRRAEC